MKEILFRGKRTDTGEWVEGAYYKRTHFYGDSSIRHYIIRSTEDLDYDQALEYYEVVPETVGRLIVCPYYDKFTDEKLFEGDIVEVYERRYRTIDPFTPTHSLCRAIIVDEHTITVDGCHYWRTQDTKTVKVIGNIYDNPELLDKKYIDYFKSFYCFVSSIFNTIWCNCIFYNSRITFFRNITK